MSVSQSVTRAGCGRRLFGYNNFLREYVATRLNGDFGGDFFRSAHKFADYYDLCAFYTFLFALIFNTHPLSLALWPPPPPAIHHAATAAINVSFLVWDAQKASQIYMLLLFAALVYEVVMSQPL